MTNLPFDTSLFPRELTAREEAERLEAVQAEAGRYFDSVTRRQRKVFVKAIMAVHVHGSQAHTDAIDLANQEWRTATAEARALYEATVECLLVHGNISDELDEAWTALSDRNKETA